MLTPSTYAPAQKMIETHPEMLRHCKGGYSAERGIAAIRHRTPVQFNVSCTGTVNDGLEVAVIDLAHGRRQHLVANIRGIRIELCLNKARLGQIEIECDVDRLPRRELTCDPGR